MVFTWPCFSKARLASLIKEGTFFCILGFKILLTIGRSFCIFLANACRANRAKDGTVGGCKGGGVMLMKDDTRFLTWGAKFVLGLPRFFGRPLSIFPAVFLYFPRFALLLLLFFFCIFFCIFMMVIIEALNLDSVCPGQC